MESFRCLPLIDGGVDLARQYYGRESPPASPATSFRIQVAEIDQSFTIYTGRWTFPSGFLTKCFEHRYKLSPKAGGPLQYGSIIMHSKEGKYTVTRCIKLTLA